MAALTQIVAMRCVYSGTELNRNRPQDDATATIEHIIPWALGGSHGFTIDDVSKKSNNDLGSKVDSPFANTAPLALMRHRLDLKGRGGSSQPIVWRCESENGVRGELRICADGKAQVVLRPSGAHSNGERLTVRGRATL